MSACPVGALRRRVCTRFGFAVAARGGGRRQPVCALRASCGDHAAAGAAGREPPCTSPADPAFRSHKVSPLTRSRAGAVRNEITDPRAGRTRWAGRVRARARSGRLRERAGARGRGGGGREVRGGVVRSLSDPIYLNPDPGFLAISVLFAHSGVSGQSVRVRDG